MPDVNYKPPSCCLTRDCYSRPPTESYPTLPSKSRSAPGAHHRLETRAPYRRAPRLFDELKIARADGTYRTLLARLARVDVLVIDDFAVAPINDQERSDLLEVMEDRYGLRSTIVTSQLPPSNWHDYLTDPTLADAICDRLVNNAHRIVLKGPSRRKDKPTNPQP
ncbi:MAG TPA: ATP-binding protein [Polyangiaceae bacterium]